MHIYLCQKRLDVINHLGDICSCYFVRALHVSLFFLHRNGDLQFVCFVACNTCMTLFNVCLI